MKKLKLSLIAIATLVAGNVKAQTYYSCIPEGCPAGQYFDGKKCQSAQKLMDSLLCPEGYFAEKGMKCCKEGPITYTFSTIMTEKIPGNSNKGVKPVLVKTNVRYKEYKITLEKGDCIKYITGPSENIETLCWKCEVPAT